ncbi:MAG: ACT domain-containing protein [Oscillospiraceae bacterium]|jgi:hypothetical protein|nr:ACT domain-containing protein [Oscillospiraceae bacterium]
MITTQLSVFVENGIGAIAEPLRLLGENGFNLRAFTIADTSDYGIIRLIADEPSRAAETLRAGGYTVNLADVLLVEMPNTPGAFSKALKKMSDNGINIEYAYTHSTSPGENGESSAYAVLRVNDTERALGLLG